jgi:hemerythrin superfamily protein
MTQPMMTQPMMTQPMSLLYDWAVQAAHQQTARHSGVVRRLLASMTGPERGGNRAPEQRRGGRRPGTGEGSWEQLVVHESAACYLYYSFLAEETDRQLRPLWELHLQMELAHLRAAGDLLRRYDGRDPREVTGTGLPEPVTLESNGRYLWRLIPDDAEDAGEAGSGDVAQAGDPGGRPDREQDLVDVLTQQHERIDDLFQRVIRAEGDEKHTAFGELAQVLAVHEVVEEEVVHPLTRRLDPDGHLADRMLDEERQISDALADAVRADAAGDPGEAIGALRDMVLAHAWSEERLEFPRLRAAVPADERREMTRAVRAAEEAAAAARGAAEEPAGAEPQTLPRTEERVRDALHAVV